MALLVVVAALAPSLPAQAAGNAQVLTSPTSLPLSDVSYRADGAMALVAGGSPGQGIVLRIAGDAVAVAHQGAHRQLAVAWSPSGAEALVAGDGGVLRTTDGSAFAPVALPAGLATFQGRAIAWKHDGSQALVAGSALLRYWAANQSLELLRQSDDEAWGAAAWKPDGSHALAEQALRSEAGWTTGRLLTFDGTSLTHVATYGQGDGLVEGIAWAASGAWALVHGRDSAGAEGEVMRWDGAALQAAFTKPADRFTAIAWRPGGTTALMTGASGQTITETDGTSFTVLVDQGPDLLGAAWHPTGDHALLVGGGGTVLRWQPMGALGLRVLAPLPGALVAGPFDVQARPEPRAGLAVQGVDARIGTGAWQPLTAGPNGLWLARLDPSTAADGALVLEVRARDATGPSDTLRIPLRLATQPPQAPLWGTLPARDEDGVVTLDWRDTGADRYEVQASRDAAFGAPTLLWQGAESAAVVHLREAGAYHLRVRGLLGGQPSPWSAPAIVEVTQTASPFLPTDAAKPGASPTSSQSPSDAARPAGELRAPGAEVPLVLMALAALALARRRAR